ncbi:IL8 protein, partial [Crypturellus undulatus]|nr:IL8 protein [Crypturellus undulatus]
PILKQPAYPPFILVISYSCFTGMAPARSGIELRCLCINTHSSFIHPKLIQNVRLIQSGPHCQNVEVIATLKNGNEVCLEPTAPWVKLIIKAILDK